MSPGCACCAAWTASVHVRGEREKELLGIIREKDEEIGQLKGAIGEQKGAIREKDEEIGQLKGAIGEQKGAIREKDEEIGQLRNANKEQEDDIRMYREKNKDLNAEKLGIKAVPAKDRKKSGRKRGRPKGTKPTINKRPQKIDREETVDISRCPECPDGGALSEKVTDTYDRVVEVVTITSENVRYLINRRWCRKCKKQVHGRVPGVAPNARVSANCGALAVDLHIKGLSHGKVAEICGNILKGGRTSCSWSYRNKQAASKKLEPEHDKIREDILKEPYLRCDESHWPIGRARGVALLARGENACLIKIDDSRSIPRLMEFLPDFQGIIGQDSYPGWFHIGEDHQMCLYHQGRIPKKDLKYLKPTGDVREFLLILEDMNSRLYAAHIEITDPDERRALADRFDAELAELMSRPYEDDRHGTIKRYRKRYRREKDYLTPFLRKKGVFPDSNGVERMVRKIIPVRVDGGGNRTDEGAKANSILLTIMATDHIRGESFFDHLLRALSGDS